jgi:hypothetical protein
LNTEAAGLVWQRASNNEDSAPQRPVGFDPQETFTKRDKTRNVKNRIGIQIMELNPVNEKETTEERMWGKRQTPQQESDENYPESKWWPGNDLRTGGERFHQRVLQKAHLLGLGKFLAPGLGLDPTANGGTFGVGGLGFLGSGSGAGGGRASLAHGLRAQQSLREWR